MSDNMKCSKCKKVFEELYSFQIYSGVSKFHCEDCYIKVNKISKTEFTNEFQTEERNQPLYEHRVSFGQELLQLEQSEEDIGRSASIL